MLDVKIGLVMLAATALCVGFAFALRWAMRELVSGDPRLGLALLCMGIFGIEGAMVGAALTANLMMEIAYPIGP